MIIESRFQIGKNGVTQGVIDALNLSLKTHNQIRIAVLKSAERNRDSIRSKAEDVTRKINYHADYKIIGFTIIIRKRSSRPKKSLIKMHN